MTVHRFAMLLAAATLASCASIPAAEQSAAGPNQLTAAERAGGWQLLFDGRTFAGWRGLGYDSVPTAHWKIVDGSIMKIGSRDVPKMPDGQPAEGGDLMTTGTYRDFELAFQWKLPPGANSGVKYNVDEAISMKSSNHAALGFEYQVLDDSLHSDNKIPSHRAASLYDLIPSDATKYLRRGEWNDSRIVVRGNHGEHWINGVMVVSYELGSPRMNELVARSKYRSIAGFADHRAGHIVIQDHTDPAWYRSIKLRPVAP